MIKNKIIAWQNNKIDPMSRLFYEINKLSPYNTCRTITISGPLSVPTLKRAIHLTSDKYHIQGFAIKTEDQDVVKLPFEKKEISIKFLDNTLSKTECIKSIIETPLDLEKGQLFDVFIQNPQENKFHILFLASHVLMDGTSFTQFVSNVFKTYYEQINPRHASNDTVLNSTIQPSQQEEILQANYREDEAILDQCYVNPMPPIPITDRKMDLKVIHLSQQLSQKIIQKKGFSNPTGSSFYSICSSIFLKALSGTIQEHSDIQEDPTIALKTPINIRRFLKGQVPSTQPGNWIRQDLAAIKHSTSKPLEELSTEIKSLLSRSLDTTTFIDFERQFEDSLETFSEKEEYQCAVLAVANLGRVDIPSKHSIKIQELTTLSNVKTSYANKWQVFINMHTLNDEVIFSVWFVDPFWTLEEKNAFLSKIQEHINAI